MDTYVVYESYADGGFLEIDRMSDLQAAQALTPKGGRVEQLTETGSVVVFQN